MSAHDDRNRAPRKPIGAAIAAAVLLVAGCFTAAFTFADEAPAGTQVQQR